MGMISNRFTKITLGLGAAALLIGFGAFGYHISMGGGAHFGGHIQHDEVNMPMLHGADTTVQEVDEMKALFRQHKDIRRVVEFLPNGIVTITETDNEDLRGLLVGHVAGMTTRVEDGRDPQVPIQSPTLSLLFERGHLITTELDMTDTGVKVTQTSTDPMVVAALQKHAAEVSDLAARGMVAVHEQMTHAH